MQKSTYQLMTSLSMIWLLENTNLLLNIGKAIEKLLHSNYGQLYCNYLCSSEITSGDMESKHCIG